MNQPRKHYEISTWVEPDRTPAYVPTSESQEQPGEPAPAIYADLAPQLF